MSLDSQQRRQSDREWMAGYRNRLAAQRAGPGMVADLVGQNADLGRAWGAYGDRQERRALSRHRVNQMLADAELAGDVKRYQRDRTEVLGLISRLRDRADPNAMYRSRGSAAERRQLAEITRSGGNGDDRTVCRSYRELTRTTDGGAMSQPSSLYTGEIVR
jgi:hypothetical protein